MQFLERGKGDGVRRVYEPDNGAEPPAAATAAPSPANAKPGAGSSAVNGPDSSKAGAPARAQGAPTETINQQPDAELKGLTKLGVVVEDLSPQAAACGLNQGTIETSVSKRLADAGFTVLGRSDEDTYLYVNIITTSLWPVVRLEYDTFLYTHATTYQGACAVQCPCLQGAAVPRPSCRSSSGRAGVRRSSF